MSDLQLPFHDQKALNAVEKYMARHSWTGYLNIGDFLDFDQISSFNKENLRALENRRIWKDYEIGNEILNRHQLLVWENNPYAKFVLLEGNHEERMERYLNANPQFEGMIEVEVGLQLKARGFEWIRSWSKGEVYTIGKANFLHGNYTNQYHPAKMAQKYGDSVFYGHTHDMMSHSIASKLTPGKVHVGQSIGCLCEREQSYMKGKPSNWEQGFAVFHFLEDGTYTYYTPRIFNGRFIGPDGVLYDGNV